MHRVNYDEVAHAYDEPWRDHSVDRHLLAFLESTAVSPPLRLLDIGCGTGKQLAANRARFPDAAMVGVDRFAGMLRIARQRCPQVWWIQADGARLPLRSNTFHYVTSQYSYPHVRHTTRLLEEIHRALAPGGRFVMTNIDPFAMPGWLVYRYFPAAMELDRQDFLPPDRFTAAMQAAGFEDVRVVHEDVSRDERLADFLVYASKRQRASQLMAIADEAYTAGIRRLEDAVGAPGGRELMVRSQFVRVSIAGEKR